MDFGTQFDKSVHDLHSLFPHRGVVCPFEHWVGDKPRWAVLSDALVLSHYSHGVAPHTRFSFWSEGGAEVEVQEVGAAQGALVREHADHGEGGNGEKEEVDDVRVGGVGKGGTPAQLGVSEDLGPAGSPLLPGLE